MFLMYVTELLYVLPFLPFFLRLLAILSERLAISPMQTDLPMEGLWKSWLLSGVQGEKVERIWVSQAVKPSSPTLVYSHSILFFVFFVDSDADLVFISLKATGQCLMWKLLVQAMVSCKVLVTQSRLFVQHTPQRAQNGKHISGSPLHRGYGFEALGEVDIEIENSTQLQLKPEKKN